MRPRVIAHIPRATNGDIVQLVTLAANDPAVVVSWPEEFPPEDAPLMVWELLRSLQYIADEDGQTVKAPRVLLMHGTGDCKSFSVFAAKMLQAAGWNTWLRFVKNDPGENFQHVYVIAERNGEWVTVDGVMDRYNKEPLHFGAIDIYCGR